MAGLLEGKVAVITGAGGGIGREHALFFARDGAKGVGNELCSHRQGGGIGREHALFFPREGAKVVVNDLGPDRHGGGKGAELADKTVADIKAEGGEATANYDSVATREGADGLVWSALNKYGRLDILVN